MNQYQPRIIRKPDVINETGLSKSTLYNRIKDGLFPPPISLGARAVGFVKSECEAVINAMIAEQTPEQIKSLVITLVQQRSEHKGWKL
ncbi:helix-turn-helix transcriptional regulator [Shewanella sp. OMA3-2]|uniref:helix-turn-helix transcriptional regulator n=1 Tax=Shewanella sp. OMA3-2 TaxID=2908650 RepID=UPI001F417A65|nr:AlpA family phage regulatory protein [Shewanella sp. OMA3-2]UJF21500.1 AlpA family phage regulatory protein [Shewanella sp. OMA3-2]